MTTRPRYSFTLDGALVEGDLAGVIEQMRALGYRRKSMPVGPSSGWGQRGRSGPDRRTAGRDRAQELLDARLDQHDCGIDCERCGLPICACEAKP